MDTDTVTATDTDTDTDTDLSEDATPTTDDAEQAPDTQPDTVAPSPPAVKSGGELALALGGTDAEGTTWIPWDTATLASPPGALLIYGPQESYHVWASVCLPADVPGLGQIKVTMSLAESPDIAALPGQVIVGKSEFPDVTSVPGFRCRLAIPVFITCACTLDDHDVRIRVDVEAADATQGWAEAVVRIEHDGGGPCVDLFDDACDGQLGGS